VYLIIIIIIVALLAIPDSNFFNFCKKTKKVGIQGNHVKSPKQGTAKLCPAHTSRTTDREIIFFQKNFKMNWFAVDKFECLSTNREQNVAEALEQKLRRLRLRRHRRPPVTVWCIYIQIYDHGHASHLLRYW
jgi:hypothetical protein